MPRAVAGDDEKEAMRACGAAAIRDCLKRKDSRLIIAKTKDRKVGVDNEFFVVPTCKRVVLGQVHSILSLEPFS